MYNIHILIIDNVREDNGSNSIFPYLISGEQGYSQDIRNPLHIQKYLQYTCIVNFRDRNRRKVKGMINKLKVKITSPLHNSKIL